MLKDRQDAFGHEMYDYFRGKGGYEIVEREDGFFDISGGPESYFSEYDEWSEPEKEAMKYVEGRVLDIGCGAGRHSLYLQEQGLDVVGVDHSSLALEVCKARGLKSAQALSVTQIARQLGIFDTILMLGNNFCLVGNAKRAKWLLRRFRSVTSEQGRIIAQTRDPYGTDLPEHLEYQAHNREKGKMSGEAKIRVRYKKYVTPWIDFLMVSKEEMKTILEGTGWEVGTFIDGEHGIYIAVIERKGI